MMDKIQPRVTQAMNEKLMAPFSPKDVKKVVLALVILKPLARMDFMRGFYKKFWNICGTEITQEVLQALNSRSIPEGWNDTTVVLIQKIDDPGLVTQFRPISLCNVIYKIISKMLAIILKEILP
jgi:hypothetical protein